MHTPARPTSKRRDGRIVAAAAIATTVGALRYGWTGPTQFAAIALAALLGHAGGQHAARRRIVLYRCQPPTNATRRRPATTVRIVGAPAWAIELPADGAGVDGAVTRAIARGVLGDLAEQAAHAGTRIGTTLEQPTRRGPRRPAVGWPEGARPDDPRPRPGT